MMPPHIRSVDLDGRIVLDGYSLVYADWGSELRLVDLLDGEPVPCSVEIDEDWRDSGKGVPGSVQVRCKATVTPAELRAGRRYRLEALGDVYEFDGWDA